jgi:gamma-glutamylcyclotransferase (GGCT)/AIG2-like uncharacterized protein YtfP
MRFLWVYGTLKPGQERWHIIEPHVTVVATDVRVWGALLNGGNYPIWVTNKGADAPDFAIGDLLAFTNMQNDESLAFMENVLDPIEGHPLLFMRTHVEVIFTPDDGIDLEEFDLFVEEGEDEVYVEATAYKGSAPVFDQYPVINGGRWPIEE